MDSGQVTSGNNVFGSSFSASQGSQEFVQQSMDVDVPLAYNGSRKGGNWKIILIVIALTFIVGTLLFILLFVRHKDSNSIESSFNGLANYIVSGVESTEAIEREKIEDGWYYAFEINNDDLGYVEELNKKLLNFTDLYYEDGGAISFDLVKIYFNDFVNSRVLSYDAILADYLEYGYDAARLSINKFYENNYDSIEMNDLVANRIKLAEIELDFIDFANENDCLINTSATECLASNQVDYSVLWNEYNDVDRAITSLKRRMRDGIIQSLLGVWDELYSEAL